MIDLVFAFTSVSSLLLLLPLLTFELALLQAQLLQVLRIS